MNVLRVQSGEGLEHGDGVSSALLYVVSLFKIKWQSLEIMWEKSSAGCQTVFIAAVLELDTLDHIC